MRPKLRFLTDDLIRSIVDEAREVLRVLGVEVNNPEALSLLGDHGAEVDLNTRRARIPGALVDKVLATAPREFRLYDVAGGQTHHVAGDRVHFTPGSAALNLLDSDTGLTRRPDTADYVRYCKVVARCAHIAAQSTAMIPGDVSERISDSYRLYLSLRHCAKPVVTGAFTADAFGVMKDLQVIVRGSEAALREKPLTVFSCCPTAPLKWCHETSQNLLGSSPPSPWWGAWCSTPPRPSAAW
jgi:trimethylamine--corrinoid protein Co-methyltransferase